MNGPGRHEHSQAPIARLYRALRSGPGRIDRASGRVDVISTDSGSSHWLVRVSPGRPGEVYFESNSKISRFAVSGVEATRIVGERATIGRQLEVCQSSTPRGPSGLTMRSWPNAERDRIRVRQNPSETVRKWAKSPPRVTSDPHADTGSRPGAVTETDAGGDQIGLFGTSAPDK